MNILIVSNLYPPHHHGGYELRCSQVVEYLQRQGHAVRVVTSRYQIGGTTHRAVICDDNVNGVPVHRFLRHHRLDPKQPGGKLYNLDVIRQQTADITRFGEILDDFTPHVVSWWNMEGVTKAILRMPGDRGIPSVHCIDDGWTIREFGAAGDVDSPFWFDFWRVKWGPRTLRPLVRTVLAGRERRLEERGVPTRVFGLPPSHLLFISAFRRWQYEQAGIDVSSSEVIYGGVAPEQFFANRSTADYADGPLRVLYAGYMDPKRGLHTIIEALGLIPLLRRQRMHLSVASTGPVVPDEYVAGVKARVEQLRLTDRVTFLGRVPHERMPEVYAANHVLAFTSTLNEGMPMVMLEAMCAGCAVPNTGSGGAIELSERAGAPLFPKDHPFALSRLLMALEEDRRRVAEIALAGQQTVLRDFTLELMLSRTAAALTRASRTREEAVPVA
jgi:glycosyltransferase involved in cell wall biosynthesis